MSINKTYLGYNAERLETSPAFVPYSKVIAWYDDENAFVAGDDSGRVLEVDLPFATQEIVNGMLERIRGYAYQPWAGTRAILDPAAELGDGVTINGVYSVLASMETTFDGLMLSDAAAPADEEVDHEYHYVSPTRKALRRKVTLGASYYGTSIDRKRGIHIAKTNADGTTASRATLNSDVVEFRNDDGQLALYFDINDGKFKFRGDVHITGGDLNINDNFIVDTEGNVSLNGDINLSGGKIVWGGNNPASGKISASQARTLITEELVSSPTIAGGRFMDLEKQNWIEMGESEDGTVGYFNHYADSYSDTDPVMVMGYYNPTGISPNWVLAPFFNIALDYVLDNKTMYANGNWDFSQATVTGLGDIKTTVEGIRGDNPYLIGREWVQIWADDTVEIRGDNDITLSACRIEDESGSTKAKLAFRMSSNYRRFQFYIDGVTWILDEDGLRKL